MTDCDMHDEAGLRGRHPRYIRIRRERQERYEALPSRPAAKRIAAASGDEACGASTWGV